MSAEYADFLATKRKRAEAKPIRTDVERGAHLFEFQRVVVGEALRRGRSALFADCGLGKTIMQLDWAHAIPGRTLLLAPLAVSHQTCREAEHFGYDARVRASDTEIGDERITITNYEKIDRFDLSRFDAVVLDESSILKSFTGKTRTKLIEVCARTPYRLACTATPAPNDFGEIGNHSEFLGEMTRVEMLSMFFVHDGGSTQNWRLKGHAKGDFWSWVASWSSLFTSPADLGFSDDGFVLPPLNVKRLSVESGHVDGSLIPGAVPLDLQARRSVRRGSLAARCDAAAQLASDNSGQWLMWCDLNDESKALAERIDGAVEVTGADSDEHKAESMLAFAEGDIRCLVTKPKIAGFGMNWQSCHQMAFVGLSDSYEAFYQASRRCWRFGQKHPVDCYIVASDAESAVVDNVMAKESAHEEMKRRMVALMKEAR